MSICQLISSSRRVLGRVRVPQLHLEKSLCISSGQWSLLKLQEQGMG